MSLTVRMYRMYIHIVFAVLVFVPLQWTVPEYPIYWSTQYSLVPDDIPVGTLSSRC